MSSSRRLRTIPVLDVHYSVNHYLLLHNNFYFISEKIHFCVIFVTHPSLGAIDCWIQTNSYIPPLAWDDNIGVRRGYIMTINSMEPSHFLISTTTVPQHKIYWRYCVCVGRIRWQNASAKELDKMIQDKNTSALTVKGGGGSNVQWMSKNVETATRDGSEIAAKGDCDVTRGLNTIN